jgi:hypothetical protein
MLPANVFVFLSEVDNRLLKTAHAQHAFKLRKSNLARSARHRETSRAVRFCCSLRKHAPCER